MTNKVITISRQFGSGGRTIGKKVAEKLGIPYYDKELVDQVAKESGFSHEFIEEIGEYASVTSSFLFNIAVSAHPMGLIDTMSVSDKLYVCQTNVIRDLAAKGPCVIVGRCADFILKDRPDTLHIFIHSDMEHRAERIVRLYGETKQTPQKRLQAQGLLQALHQLQLGRSGKLRPLPRLWHVGRRQVRRYHLRRRADAVSFSITNKNPVTEVFCGRVFLYLTWNIVHFSGRFVWSKFSGTFRGVRRGRCPHRPIGYHRIRIGFSYHQIVPPGRCGHRPLRKIGNPDKNREPGRRLRIQEKIGNLSENRKSVQNETDQLLCRSASTSMARTTQSAVSSSFSSRISRR